MPWKEILRNNFTKLDALCEFLELDEMHRAKIAQKNQFPLNLPFRLASKIAKNSIDDPLFRQFVPLIDEEIVVSGFYSDPVEDLSFCKTSKLIHKYPKRVLLISTSACAMHCRFCFRRNFPYDVKEKSFEKELELIAQDSTLKEVILSGGDPLSLSNRALQTLFDALEKIPHITRVRLHTRFPVGIPERLEPALLDLFENRRYQVWMILHCNHPNELDEEILSALKKVLKRGVPLLNHTVLLKGVNDSIETLEALSERLTDHGILPYCLNQLDRVKGSHHFEVDESIGLALIANLQKRTSGYGVPKYVREIPGRQSKTLLQQS